MVFIKEKVLEDSYPVYGNYLYVCDGTVIRCDLMRGTIRDLKKDLRSLGYKAEVIKDCDIHNRYKYQQQDQFQNLYLNQNK